MKRFATLLAYDVHRYDTLYAMLMYRLPNFSYDKRCYSCDKNKEVKPEFNFRSQTCCDGNIKDLLAKKTCCCEGEVFDPTDKVCCKGKIIKRPDDMPGDCCSMYSSMNYHTLMMTLLLSYCYKKHGGMLGLGELLLYMCAFNI